MWTDLAGHAEHAEGSEDPGRLTVEGRQEGAAGLVDDGVALVHAAVAQAHQPLERVHEREVANPRGAEGDAPACRQAEQLSAGCSLSRHSCYALQDQHRISARKQHSSCDIQESDRRTTPCYDVAHLVSAVGTWSAAHVAASVAMPPPKQ